MKPIHDIPLTFLHCQQSHRLTVNRLKFLNIHHSGTSAATILRVYVQSSNGARHLASTFYGQPTVRQQWQYAAVPVGSNDLFRIVFEAVAGNEAQAGGVVAIDDVTFTDACREGKACVTHMYCWRM